MTVDRIQYTSIVVVLAAIGMMALTGTALATDVVDEHNTTASFDVSNVTIEDGENVTVIADITNPGAEPAIQAVELRIDGELIETRDWALNPNETEQISFELSANMTEAVNLTDGSIVSVQTRTHGDVVVFGATEPPAASITFDDQTSDGTAVTVANVSNAETPYYAAVWTVNESGEPETLIGAAQVTDNETSNLTVAFDDPIDESQTLVAAVHPDADGDADTVDPVADDIRASDTANVTVEMPVSASVTFEDQTSDGASVVVANASSTETPYYTAVWTVNNETGEPEMLLGAAQVDTNETSNQTVAFDEPINASQTLVAAVHPDADGDISTVDPVAAEILASDTANVTVESTEPPSAASITFDDQTSDGTAVTVANTSNSETPYYAAVWTVDNETGEPETLLGASQVTENESSDLPVAFEQPIEENATLVAAVHPDADGNASTVDPVVAEILASDTANVTVEAPEPPAEAAITFEDQPSDGASVVVANASNAETPYYAAVWTVDNETGEPETLLGVEQLSENETGDLTVDFADPINESQMLVAAVHPDADGNASTVDPVADDILASDAANVTVETNDSVDTSLSFENQTSDGTTVTVANASSSDSPFYVAIYGSEANDELTMIGLQQVLEGQATNLTIALEEPLSESGSVVAAIHADEDGDAGTIDPVTNEFLNVVTATVTVESPGTNTTSTATP